MEGMKDKKKRQRGKHVYLYFIIPLQASLPFNGTTEVTICNTYNCQVGTPSYTKNDIKAWLNARQVCKSCHNREGEMGRS